MKILHVAHFFYPCLSAGGVVNASYQIANKQVAEGDELKVYTSDACKKRLTFEGSRYNQNLSGISVDYFRNISNKFKLATMLDTPIFAPFKIRKDIKNYDIIHIHEHRQTLAIISSYFARKYNIPYIIQAHGSVLPFFQKKGLKDIFDKLFGFKILHNASKVFALTETEKKQYLKMGLEEDKIEIVPLGINLKEYKNLPKKGNFRSRFNIGNKDKLILFVGRIHEIKGLELLVDAFNLLINELSDENQELWNFSIKLAIVGPDDGFLDKLLEKIANLNLEDNIIVTGPLYSEEKKEALVDCDLFVMPSKYESFTTSGLEAMACSKPLVLTKNNHIGDWVHNSVGLTCDYDKNSLADSIKKILLDEKLAIEFGNKGKHLIKSKYNWDVIIKQINEIYIGAIGKV